MKRRSIDVPEAGTKSFRYNEQQKFLNELAEKYGFVCYRPSYHGANRDANTVLLYTVEDERHNRLVDMQPSHYTESERRDTQKYQGIEIPDKYVWKDYFWWFENTDINGMISYDFANHGKIDLRGLNWMNVLEGNIRFAYAKKRQRDYIRASGGILNICEADNTYNDMNREIIASLHQKFGKAYMGNVNYYDQKRQDVITGGSIYEEYTGQMVYNFECTFVVPEPDEELQRLIREWNADEKLPKKYNDADEITSRVEKIGGVNLIWF